MNVDRLHAHDDSDAATESAPSPGGAAHGVEVWLALTAPGMLVTRSVVLLALVLTPSLTTRIYVDAVARTAGAALLLAHIGSTRRVVRRPERWSTTIFLTLLAIDGLLAGVVAGADLEWRGASVPIVAVALALGFETAGWPGLACCAAAAAFGVGAAARSGIGALLMFSPALASSTTLDVETLFAGVTTVAAAVPLCAPALSVEPTFAGALVADAPVCAPATTLSVETRFTGHPAIGSRADLFLPMLVLVFGAIAVGGAVSLLRVRSARKAVATQGVATA